MSGDNYGNRKKRLEAKEWRDRAIRLAAQGFTIREIAKRVDRSPSLVHTAVTEALKAVPVEAVEAIRSKRAEGLARQIRIWDRSARRGDRDAAEVLVKLQAREAKLLGLDAPEKREMSLTVSDEQLAARLAALADAEAKGEGDREADDGGEGSPADPSRDE